LGSEGYLLNQPLTPAPTSGPTPGRFPRSAGFPVEIGAAPARQWDRLIICYRMSMADYVADGQSWDEIIALATEVEAVGATMINSGFGWHEARVPTIVTSVPNSAFVDISSAVAEHVDIPVVASNRINMPQAAEEILADTHVRLISMARPLLSDPDWVNKAQADAADEINTCISCNQRADHAFVQKKVSCLLNPRAGRETDLVLSPTRRTRRIAVVGAGPAGRGDRSGDRSTARPRRHAVRSRRCHRRPIRHGQKDSRQGRVQRDDSVLQPDARQTRRGRATEHPHRR
jgi:2,4-dienoyl-CoA reductase (NADPH2)